MGLSLILQYAVATVGVAAHVPLVLEDYDLLYRECLYLMCTVALRKQGFLLVIGPAVGGIAISVLPLVCAVLFFT